MRRSRTGCRACRVRKVKCDENRPVCSLCERRQIPCSYETVFQWVPRVEFQGPPRPAVVKNRYTNKQRRGPVSKNRALGQEAIGANIFGKENLERLPTVMIEQPLDKDEVVVTDQDGGDYEGQFRKFSVLRTTSLRASPAVSDIVPVAARDEESWPTPDEVDLTDMAFESSSILLGLSEQDFFDHFVTVTADELVPIPYETNPFLTLLPEMALVELSVWELLVAYGASHKSMILRGPVREPHDEMIVVWLLARCEHTLKQLRDTESSKSQSLALLSACLLAMMELDRGNRAVWQRHMATALDVMQSTSNWELSLEMNSMTFRLVGYMNGLGSLQISTAEPLMSFPTWPEWSGSLDYLTAIDLNLLPLFTEAAGLIRLIHILAPEDLSTRARINAAALNIIQRMNDYWLEEYWPDSKITAMCTLFQMALQIHVLRRVLRYPSTHYIVRRIYQISMSVLDRWVPPTSSTQRSMGFTLGTLASEALTSEHRASLLRRLKQMAMTGFSINWRLCEDVQRHWNAGTSFIAAPDVISKEDALDSGLNTDNGALDRTDNGALNRTHTGVLDSTDTGP